MLLALVSTRLCLDPDLGVMLLARNTGTGEATSSRPVLFGIGSDRCCPRLASGVTIAAVWLCEVGVDRVPLVAILGVRGVLLSALAAWALNVGI